MYKILSAIFTLAILLPSKLIAAESIPLIQVYPEHTELNVKQKTIESINTQASTTIINNKQIVQSNSNNLIELLNNQSGIQSIQPSSSSNRPVFSIRGFGDNALYNTAVLINGQPYFNPDIGAPLLNVIPLSEIEQIEISPTSSSVLYGDQAVGGVINLVTKKPSKEAAEALINYGSFASRKVRFLLSKPFDNGFAYQLSGSTFKTNNYRNHNQEKINNIFVALFYKDLYLRYNKTNHHLQLPGQLSFQQAVDNSRQAENNVAYNNQDYDIFQLGYKHGLGQNWLGEIDSSLRLMSGIGAYEFGNQVTPFNESRTTLTVQPKLSGVIDIGSYSILPTIGWESCYGKYRYSNSEAKQTQHAIYGYLELPLTSKLTTSLGHRYAKAFYNLSSGTNKNPNDDAAVNEIELSYQTAKTWKMFAKLAENYRFPKTDEIMYTHNGYPLKSQTGVSYETGINYKKGNLLTSLSLYQLDLKNEIMFIPGSGAHFGYNENLDPTRRLGITASLNFTPIEFLQINGSYDFIRSKILSGVFKDKEIPFVARNNFRITTNLFPHRNFKVLFEATYTGSRYPISDIKNITPKLGGTTIYNCGVSFEQKHYTINIRANNLTNKLYYGYVVTSYTDPPYKNGYYPATGLNILGTLEIRL